MQLPVSLSKKTVLRATLSLGLSALFLYLALHNVDLQEVGQAMLLADGRYVGLALLSVAVNTLAKALRWKVLLGQPGRQVSIWRTLIVLLVGQMLNTLIPARIGDLARAYMLGSQGPGRVFTLGTVMLEKIIDMLCYGLLFALLLMLIPLPTWVNGSGYTIVAAAGLTFLIVIIVAFQRVRVVRWAEWLLARLPERFGRFLVPRLHSALASLDVLQNRGDLLALALWSAVVWGTAVLNIQLALLALDLHVPISALLLVLIGLQAGITVPSVPGELGLFEYICILALSLYQVEQAQALSYGLLLHVIVLLPSTLLGLLFFWLSGWGRPQLEAAIHPAEGSGS